MRIAQYFLLLMLALALPFNSAMAALMPVCLNDQAHPAVAQEVHEHAGAFGQKESHVHSEASNACKVACEKCSFCSQGAVETQDLTLPLVPPQQALVFFGDALAPDHIGSPPDRPPMSCA